MLLASHKQKPKMMLKTYHEQDSPSLSPAKNYPVPTVHSAKVEKP